MNYLFRNFVEFYEDWKQVFEIKIPYKIYNPGILEISSKDLIKTERFRKILLDSKNLIQ
jgi:hypothetical protein